MTIEKMSTAFKAVQDYRDAMNKGRSKILAKDLSCVVYLYENLQGEPCAIGYRGRAKKPAFNYRYRNEAGRAESVSKWMLAQSENNSSRRKTEPRQLSVDDVLSASWGYDQTNVNYYKIIKLIGNSMVELIEIGQKREESDHMTGECIPDPDKVIGEPMRRKAKGKSVRIDSVIYASKIEPMEVAGCRLYKPVRWSSYH